MPFPDSENGRHDHEADDEPDSRSGFPGVAVPAPLHGESEHYDARDEEREAGEVEVFDFLGEGELGEFSVVRTEEDG